MINAPGMVKLLSLADLGGLADLAEGEGISFETLEINMEKNKDTLKINEILALGPSVSVLMEGYQDQNVTSLRGTLVPAKTLNTLISKIPVIGDIVIPKEVGEGLFGISFKMKGESLWIWFLVASRYNASCFGITRSDDSSIVDC